MSDPAVIHEETAYWEGLLERASKLAEKIFDRKEPLVRRMRDTPVVYAEGLYLAYNDAEGCFGLIIIEANLSWMHGGQLEARPNFDIPIRSRGDLQEAQRVERERFRTC